jgi:hypothetical protein
VIPEANKRSGVCYAFTDGGLELPVIDITHPAFHQALSEEQQFAGARRYGQDQASKGKLARLAERFVLPIFLKRSIIGRGLLKSRGAYLDGLSTYLMKLSPDLLGAGYATPLDRKIVQGLNAAGMSLGQRTQDMAETLAEGLRPLLTGDLRPLHFVNIAGGPSLDSLNALILLYKEEPAAFDGRLVQVHVLDLEAEGAHFGAAALAALQGEGGPLHGLQASLIHQAYDWDDPSPLRQLLQSLPPGAPVALSSEGGLFDYGSDAAISANLRSLRDLASADTVVACTISRPDFAGGTFSSGGIAKVILRQLGDLERLAQQDGWTAHASRSRPMSIIAKLTRS